MPDKDQRKKRLLYARKSRTRLSPTKRAALEKALAAWQIELLEAGAQNIHPRVWFGGEESAREDYALEIGFGGGEHLLQKAAQHPTRGFIGCEPFLDGVAKLASGAQSAGLDNIRLHCGDGGDVLDALASESLAEVYLFYPDPWPKKKHHKRRFVNGDTLAGLYRVLQSGGALYFASDHVDYVNWTMIEIARFGKFTLSLRSADCFLTPAAELDWQPTRYEQKARLAGRTPYYLRLLKP